MVRRMLFAFLIAAPVAISGCAGSGQSAVSDPDWFRKQTREFDTRHAEHVKQSSDAVRDYQQYRNQ